MICERGEPLLLHSCGHSCVWFVHKPLGVSLASILFSLSLAAGLLKYRHSLSHSLIVLLFPFPHKRHLPSKRTFPRYYTSIAPSLAFLSFLLPTPLASHRPLLAQYNFNKDLLAAKPLVLVDTPMEVSLNEKVEFLPPGYAKDTVFQFKNPLVSDILQSDAMAKQCDFTLVSEAKGVIKGAAPTGRSESAPRRRRRSSSSSTSPAIGGLRRLMKRAHTPEGLVTHYEDRLRAFLDLDTSHV
ncbi:hypothetical protein GQ54DRAFT_172508 [Martensiomyces pterosporus]|nr:hypothetical protein GQ54DRAFT_172508 [Martensiomyces pterosporus]